MDNCYLEKLLAKPGKLTPIFNKNVLNYNIILGVSDNKTTLDFFTEDSGASYDIIAEGSDGSKTINVNEGETKMVKIDVTAEDGRTHKCYLIEIKRHSSKVAIIESLNVNNITIEPNFKSDVFEYSAIVGLKIINIEFNIQTPDKKSKIKINNEEVKSQYPLTLGCTLFNINVTSPDGSNNQNYKVKIIRRSIPLYIYIINPLNRLMVEDPISLSPCVFPIKLKCLYSWDILTKFEAEQFLNFNRNDFQPKLEYDEVLDWSISEFDSQVLNSNLILSASSKVNTLGSVISNSQDSANTIYSEHISYSFFPFNDTINLTPDWQKTLVIQEYTENDKAIFKLCEAAIKEYLLCRPNKPIFHNNMTINHEHPSKKLSNAISMAVQAAARQKSESKYHFALAQLLEENYLNHDIFNLILHKVDKIESESKMSVEVAGRDTKAVLSAKQDEILAICKIHGYSGMPSDAEQLIALDKEYHALLSQNQSSRADAIQNLYEWKSKRVSQEANMSSQVRNEETSIGQAFSKYLAALSLEKNSFLYNFHVGRLLIIQGKYKEAMERLNTALCSNAKHLPSKLCLGLCMSFIPEMMKDRSQDAIYLIVDALLGGLKGIIDFMMDNDKEDICNNQLLSSDEIFFNIRNPLISKSVLQLGNMLLKNTKTKITVKPLLIIHWALHLASQGWSQICVGNNLMQFEYTMIECHKILLCFIHEEIEKPSDQIYVNRSLWLLNFINSSSITISDEILQLLEKVSQVPLYFDCSNQHFLTFYGEILSKKADQMVSTDPTFVSTIETAIKLLHFALDIKRENKTEAAIKFVKDQAWYKDKKLIIFQFQSPVDKTKALEIKGLEPSKPNPVAPGTKPTPSKPTANTQKKTVAAPPKKAPAKPGTVANKNAPAPIVKDKVQSEAKEESEKLSVSVEKPEMQYSRNLADTKPSNSYRIELSLARAYRINKQYHESVKYYKISGIEQFCTTVNERMQEYVEALICLEDYDSALKVYCMISINEKNLSFDDGYICGEIVRLLMKLEKYKDKMLIKYASLWAKIFGLGIIEKEITTLESKNLTDVCKEIYASVHGKKVDDPDLKMFFQSKCWL